MTTSKQHAANRANAALSTGPVTEEGKLISSQNGITHGLSSPRISPLDANAQLRRNQLRDAYRSQYQPATQVDMDAIEDMAAARTRIEKIEDAAAAEPLETPRYALLMRYLRQAQRQYHRARSLVETASRRSGPAAELAQATVALRLLTVECNAPEPLRSEMASLRRRLFTAAPPPQQPEASHRPWCDPAPPSTPPNQDPSSTPM